MDGIVGVFAHNVPPPPGGGGTYRGDPTGTDLVDIGWAGPFGLLSEAILAFCCPWEPLVRTHIPGPPSPGLTTSLSCSQGLSHLPIGSTTALASAVTGPFVPPNSSCVEGTTLNCIISATCDAHERIMDSFVVGCMDRICCRHLQHQCPSPLTFGNQQWLPNSGEEGGGGSLRPITYPGWNFWIVVQLFKFWGGNCTHCLSPDGGEAFFGP